MEGIEGIHPSRKEVVSAWDSEKFKNAVEETGGLVIEEAGTPSATALDMERFGLFPPAIAKAMQLQALFADHYLKGPVIQGPFESPGMEGDWDKRNWRQKLIVDFGEEAQGLLETNRMRGNLMAPVLSQADRIVLLLDEARLNSPDAAQVHKAVRAILAPAQPFDSFASRYEHMPLTDRVNVVREVSAAARAYLDLVTEPAQEMHQAA